MGPKRFDCSGLVVRSVKDVLGADLDEETEGLRHVREMWQAANEDGEKNLHTAVAKGALAVFCRKYTINGEYTTIPGHIGIVSGGINGLDVIHANPRTGKVEEVSLRNKSTVMGYIAINLFTIKKEV